MSVGVVGAGDFGLVTGAALASVGHEVVCMDADADKVALLASGSAPFYEPVVVDGRNMLDPEVARAAGIRYASVGRP